MFVDWSEDYDENAAPSHTPILDDDDQHDNDDIASPPYSPLSNLTSGSEDHDQSADEHQFEAEHTLV